jgi:endonuclease YncB( thermonuclease family)
MELASRIISVLLGLAVMIFVLWPVTIPVGFGEVWWASRQAQSRSQPPAPAHPAPPPQDKAPAPQPQAARPNPSSHAVMPAVPEAMPAKEKAEDKQLAALNDKDKTGALAPKPATKLYRRVTVRDGGTLQAGGVVIRLAGIAANEADATCKGENGKTWRCGAAAKAALTRLIRARAVTCVLPKGGEHNIFIARCSVGGTDLSTWMVRQGWATPKEPKEPALSAAAEAAQAEKIGLWRASQ